MKKQKKKKVGGVRPAVGRGPQEAHGLLRERRRVLVKCVGFTQSI